MVKEKAKKFSCLKCGTSFEAYPSDDRHDTATRNESDYKDHIKVDYRCKECSHINIIYWGHPKPAFAVFQSFEALR